MSQVDVPRADRRETNGWPRRVKGGADVASRNYACLMITAFVLIGAEPDAIAELAPSLAEIDGVREAHSVAGGDTDLISVLRVATHQDIATTVTERIAKLPGVTSTATMIAFRSYSDTQLEAGYEGFGD